MATFSSLFLSPLLPRVLLSSAQPTALVQRQPKTSRAKRKAESAPTTTTSADIPITAVGARFAPKRLASFANDQLDVPDEPDFGRAGPWGGTKGTTTTVDGPLSAFLHRQRPLPSGQSGKLTARGQPANALYPRPVAAAKQQPLRRCVQNNTLKAHMAANIMFPQATIGKRTIPA